MTPQGEGRDVLQNRPPRRGMFPPCAQMPTIPFAVARQMAERELAHAVPRPAHGIKVVTLDARVLIALLTELQRLDDESANLEATAQRYLMRLSERRA